MTSLESLRAWLSLRAIPGVGDTLCCRLIEAFGSPEAVLAAPPAQLRAVEQVSAALAEAVAKGPDRESRLGIAQELAKLERLNASVITYLDARYPARLKMIPDPPPLLYATGALSLPERPAIAIVGSRHGTSAGRLLTEEFSHELAACGFSVVSGLARGIDAAAHRGAIRAQGRTVAVLGCGIDRTYPPEHKALRRMIEDHGAVLSEFPLGAPPHGHHFPRRNRIISGMALGVLVTEATLESGSLVTARLAADQGREVFAVPGFVKHQTSRGPHSLIKQGAKLVECVDDILQELLPLLDPAEQAAALQARRREAAPKAEPEGQEGVVYRLLSEEPVHVDDLIKQAALPAAQVSSLLLSLELKGLLRQLPGRSYIRL